MMDDIRSKVDNIVRAGRNKPAGNVTDEILDAIAPAIRAAALEEAAREAERAHDFKDEHGRVLFSRPQPSAYAIAYAIRALITAPPPTP